jgi:hypothetical protein
MVTRLVTVFACRHCDAEWVGEACHCSQCHATLPTVKEFDRHVCR